MNPSNLILLVDDELPIRRFLRASLKASYAIMEAENGYDALRTAAVSHPDLVILDLGLPDMDGLEVIRRLREWTIVPVLVVSVRDGEEDKVAALDSGADDYLTKPFSTVELMARIRAALRHCVKTELDSTYQNGDLIVNLAMRQVLVNDQLVTLTPTEYEILRSLVNHAGRVLTHKQLILAVWKSDSEANSHLLHVNISNLRRKIEKDPSRPTHIVTEPGVGYRLKDSETPK